MDIETITDSLRSMICDKDSSFCKLLVNYDDATLVITEDSGRIIKLTAVNYLSLYYDFHWDENIISNIIITKESNRVRDTLEKIYSKYGTSPKPGGGKRVIGVECYELQVLFLDESSISIVFQDLEITTAKSD